MDGQGDSMRRIFPKNIREMPMVAFPDLSFLFAHLCPFQMQFMGVSRLSECDIACMYLYFYLHFDYKRQQQADDPADSSGWIDG